MNTPRSVEITAAGLSCALGESVAACRQAMFSQTVNSSELNIDWFDEPISMPWYGLENCQSADAEARFYQIIESVVQQALHESQLSAQEQREMPVFLGSSSFEVSVSEWRYRHALAESSATAYPIQISSIGHLVGHLRRQLKLHGPDFTYGTACAASANAVLGASRMIAQGQADHALVIGVELHNLTTLAGFHSLQLIAEDCIRPFDVNRTGMILGESCAAVVLSASGNSKPESECRPAARSITVQGGASLCDTSSVTSTNTDGKSIAQVVTHALQDAQLEPDDISLIKAHGTASVANDLAEATGLHQVFSTMPPLFALKPYIGHTLGACGVTELILAAEVLRHGMTPLTPGFDQVDSALKITPCASGYALPPKGSCLLNYFGFGGNNSVLVLGYDMTGNSSVGVNA